MTTRELAATARSQTWWPLGVAGLLASVAVAASRDEGSVFPIQLASIVFASVVGYALDDPAFEILGPSPRSLLERRARRLVLMLPAAVAWWGILLVAHGSRGTQETVALTAFLAGLLGLGVGAAGVAQRRSERGVGGFVVGPILLAAVVASSIVAPRWRPLPLGDVPGGLNAVTLRWSLAACVGVAVFLASSRDPAARRGRSPIAQATRPGDPSSAVKPKPAASQASIPPSTL